MNIMINNVICNTIENRVYKFTFNEIIEEIKNNLISLRRFDPSINSSSYEFKDSVKEAINYYLNSGVIIKIGEYYVPYNTYLFNKYDVKTDIIAYSYGYKQIGYFDIEEVDETLVDIDTCCNANKLISDTNKLIVLVGELLEEGLWDVSEVSFDEVNTLYHMLKKQGAPKEEIVQYVLNYYNAVKSENKKFKNRYIITPHVKKLSKNNL